MEVLMHEAAAANSSVRRSIYTGGGGPMQPPPLITTSPNGQMLLGHPEKMSLQLQQQGQQQQLPVVKEPETMDLVFSGITYKVSLGPWQGSKEILHGINGRLPSRQLIALMGPSGAGKSTLLDVLSGYRITGVEGTVYVNGRVRNLETFRRSSAYITQDDRLQLLLTVLENMRVAADLKLGTNIPKYEKETIIEEILSTLGLYEHMSTLAGRLSGGQRKRLSIALELVNNPTVLFLDEPTTGLDSSSCMQVCNLLKMLSRQGKTIICTIHQPSATMFQLFDQVYVLAKGECLYQGATSNLLPYLESLKLPCPMYHNPADYVIELACGEYGEDKIEALIQGSQNGRSDKWFDNPNALLDAKTLRALNPLSKTKGKGSKSHQPTSQFNQIMVLMKRSCIKIKRDTTLTHLRILVNISIGLMLGVLFIDAGNSAKRMIHIWNLLFGCLIHHMMTTMMLTVLTFPTEMSNLQKEHFNRWYSLKSYYISTTLMDIPVLVLCCFIFSSIVYFMSSQPYESVRFGMFFSISLLVAFIAQSFGLLIGSAFDVVNGTFLAPTLSVPMMMFAGFGVALKDMPGYLNWGTYISYLRYGLEGYVNAIYGMMRPDLVCPKTDDDIDFCITKRPSIFVKKYIGMEDDQFWTDITALCYILVVMRIACYVTMRWKLSASR
ncbi:hypothetical protein QAD02_024194 [Eretmocerus hayati]|uniref:Uncharacterized protein n=1 Tax=Eretmocerus hayati TaxID=131215 RepID=A0ACC2Q0J9_9HYME|nr:hypothetical protein QAD02_024194 [Eretmocerus hayati]